MPWLNQRTSEFRSGKWRPITDDKIVAAGAERARDSIRSWPHEVIERGVLEIDLGSLLPQLRVPEPSTSAAARPCDRGSWRVRVVEQVGRVVRLGRGLRSRPGRVEQVRPGVTTQRVAGEVATSTYSPSSRSQEKSSRCHPRVHH